MSRQIIFSTASGAGNYSQVLIQGRSRKKQARFSRITDYSLSKIESKSAEAYSTVFLKIMQKGIDHFDITHNHQPLVKELIPWFESELAKIGEKAPANKAKLMATFVRLPESQAGGNKRLAKKH